MKRIPLSRHLIAATAIVTIFMVGLAAPGLAKFSKYQINNQGHNSEGRGFDRRPEKPHRSRLKRHHGKRWGQPRQRSKPAKYMRQH